MTTFFNMLIFDCKRTLFSKRFVAAVLGFSLITFITLFDEIRFLRPGIDSVTYIYQIIRYLDFHIVYILFGAIPGTLLFCEDWKNHFIRLSVTRCSKKQYATSKVIACFVSAVGVVMISETLTLGLFGLRFPLFNVWDTGLGIYSIFASNEKIFLFLGLKMFYEALNTGFLSIFALWLSTKITNTFVTIVSPLLAYYLINTVSLALNVPGIFNINALSKGYVAINSSPIVSFLYTVLVFLFATSAFGIFFINSCTRRIENG